MKTIKLNDKIKRVADNDAETFIKIGWKYISKSEWKKNRKEKTTK